METNDERLDRIENSGEGLEDEDFDWLIERAGRVQELERQTMRYRRALKHITVFPTYFSREQHSKRALKIARKVLIQNET